MKNFKAVPYRTPAERPIKTKRIPKPKKYSFKPKAIISRAMRTIDTEEVNFNLLEVQRLAIYVEKV